LESETVPELIETLLNNVYFVFERLNWWDLIDLVLVTLIFFSIFLLLRETQAILLLRGFFILIVLVSLLTSLDVLPAFSWLVRSALPALLLAIPVIFAPEIRRTLERLGRAGSIRRVGIISSSTKETIDSVVNASSRLAERQHGALIVMQRIDNLDEYIKTGVLMNAQITAELLLQIFYPNTPLHDGAVIVSGGSMLAASCVMPLSSSGVLSSSPERLMGLRHRAALGISEVTDAVAVVVSEETGNISVVHGGRMIRRLDADRLENILLAFYRPLEETKGLMGFLSQLFSRPPDVDREEK
jgi:diadenylate cyclase